MVRSSVLSHRASLNSKGARVASMMAFENLWLSQFCLTYFMVLNFEIFLNKLEILNELKGGAL